jgi:hypothetical protein
LLVDLGGNVEIAVNETPVTVRGKKLQRNSARIQLTTLSV